MAHDKRRVGEKREFNPNAMAGINTHALVLKSLAGKRGKVADLGAGQGTLSVELARMGFEVYACDVCAEGFQANGLPNIHFCVVDLHERLPYPDGSLDFACAVEVIEHLENPRRFLRECHRILKSDGMLILSTPNVLSLASHISFLFKGCLIYFDQREYLSNHHITPLRLQDVENMFREVGFRMVKIDFNVGKLPIPKLRHKLPMLAKPFRNRWLGESLMVWAVKDSSLLP